MKFRIPLAGLSIALSFFTGSAQVPNKAKVVARSEQVFDGAMKALTMPAPGCSVGVSLNGESVFEKAFGIAEMEHNVANTWLTIFESGREIY
jgi:CubicO group peptidase (beta-lactamase class C family)